MKYIGTNASSMMAGALNPLPAATTSPSEAAREYAGAVEAMPTTMLPTSPSAPPLRPLDSTTPGAETGFATASDMGTVLPGLSLPAADPIAATHAQATRTVRRGQGPEDPATVYGRAPVGRFRGQSCCFAHSW